jgi:hypothetical protein
MTFVSPYSASIMAFHAVFKVEKTGRAVDNSALITPLNAGMR